MTQVPVRKSQAAVSAGETIERRGSGQRRYRNALVFVAADVSNVEAARENARRVRAWQSILDDADLRGEPDRGTSERCRWTSPTQPRGVAAERSGSLGPCPLPRTARRRGRRQRRRGRFCRALDAIGESRWRKEHPASGLGEGRCRWHRVRRDGTQQSGAEPGAHLAAGPPAHTHRGYPRSRPSRPTLVTSHWRRSRSGSRKTDVD